MPKPRKPPKPAAPKAPATVPPSPGTAHDKGSKGGGERSRPSQTAHDASSDVVRRKPDDERKEVQLHIRITAAQREAMALAAKREGLDFSSWVRWALLKAAGPPT